MKYFLIDGFFGHKNLGDELILSQIRKYFSKKIKNHQLISISTKNKSNNSFYFNRKSLFSYFSFIKLISKSEGLIIGGGGLFPYGYSKRFFIETFLFKLFNKKVFMYGVGIDFIKYKIFWKIFISQLDLIIVRDINSKKLINSILPNKEVFFYPDAVFSIGTSKTNKKNSLNKNNIIFNLAMPFNEKEILITSNHNRLLHFINEFSSFIYYLNKDYINQFIFNVFLSNHVNVLVDLLITELNKRNIFNITVNKDKDKILESFQDCNISINMRYHSTILSLLNLNKFINISYSPKSKYLVEDFGFSFTEVYFGVNKNEFFKIEKDIMHTELIDTLKIVNKNKSFQSKSYKLKLQYYINESKKGLNTLIQSLKNI